MLFFKKVKCIQPTVHTTQNYSRIIQMYSAQCAQCTPLKTILELYKYKCIQPTVHNAQNYSIDYSRIIQLYSLFSPLCTPLKTVLELYKCIQPTVHTTQNYSRIIQMYSAQCARLSKLF